MNYLISIIVPVYNEQDKILRCLISISNQDYTNYEVIIIDDGSNDSSPQIIDEFCLINNQFRCIHIENNGVSNARNIGIKEANGKYLMFMDSDDYIYPYALSSFINAADIDYDIFLGRFYVLKNGKIAHDNNLNFKDSQDFWNNICINSCPYGYVWAKMYKKSVILDNNIMFKINMNSQEDLDYNLTVYKHCFSFKFINDSGYVYEYKKSNRSPKYIDYINNQIKLYSIASHCCNLTDKARNSILERINLLVYCYFYSMNKKQEYLNCISNINTLTSLNEFMVENIRYLGKYKILKKFYQKKYNQLYQCIKIRKIFGKIKRE